VIEIVSTVFVESRTIGLIPLAVITGGSIMHMLYFNWVVQDTQYLKF
jgi:hypothetical protein